MKDDMTTKSFEASSVEEAYDKAMNMAIENVKE
jgi:hypothetical protein